MSVDPIAKEFRKAVNMSAAAMEKHLQSPESKKVGYKEHDGDESVGHKEGAKIVELLDKKETDLLENDLKQMHKIVGYIHRHLAQRPEGDISDTNWRTSLMNWGHDPMKD